MGPIRSEKMRIAIAAIPPNVRLDKSFASIQSPAYTVPSNLRTISCEGKLMATIREKELVDRIAKKNDLTQSTVKAVIQCLLDEIVSELSKNNQIQFTS
jgi:hypothetical protein